MPRGTKLINFEKGQILALKKEVVSYRDIAKTIHRSVGAVQNFLKSFSLNGRDKKVRKTMTVRNEG